MTDEDRKNVPSATTAPAPPRPDYPPAAWPQFEGYKIVEELPSGGQAVVYKAVHLATKTKVVLKVLPPGMLTSAKARHQFKQEVDLATSLHHPHIVGIRDSGVAQGQYYFAMEYVSGQTPDRYVADNHLSLRDSMVLFGKICNAVAHAHQHGVIHRDLKLSNILVDERGDPHVLDFGLAKGAGTTSLGPDGVSAPSMTGEIKGTLAYMSPEQAGGRPELMDVRTDVYSLGVMFYLILTGDFPYNVTGTALETIRHIEATEPKRPRQITRKFNPEIEAILLKCLAKEPGRRYHSAAELGEDIQRWLDGLPIFARSVSSVYLLRKIIGRHRYTATIVSLLLLITAGFSAAGLFLYGRMAVAERRSRYAGQEAEAMALGWARASGQVVFLHFLDAWHNGDATQMQRMSRIIAAAGNKKEALAVAFLRDPNNWEAKQSDLRRSLSPAAEWFTDFVIAESYLKRGKLDPARDAYKRSYQGNVSSSENAASGDAFGDRLLKSFVAGRLYRLDSRSGRESSPPDAEERRGR